MDGNFSNCDLELAARDDDCNILVDDAGWNVFWSLDINSGMIDVF